MKEAAELSASSPSASPHFEAHPVSDSDLFEWHFTLAGPPAPSPYANGIYHGRISLPPQYPLRPPMFRFLTPSGRFQVNQEICLSISGHHEESWQPAWGIRLALTAIRSFMDGDAKGQLGGVEANIETRRELARRSRSWRCETCGSRTNEETMREWRDMCSAKGVNVDEEGNETIPEGMEVGFKKPKEEQVQASSSTTQDKGSGRMESVLKPAVFDHDYSRLKTDVALSSSKDQPISTTRASLGTSPPPPSRSPNSSRGRPTAVAAQHPSSPLAQRQPVRSPDPVPAWIDNTIATIVIMLIGIVVKKLYYA